MKCRIDEDDRCIRHQTPVEHMAYCPHDGNTCDHTICTHPACHTVTARYTRDPFLGTKWTARCELCGKTGPTTSDKEDALAWEHAHHEEVWQS